MACYDSLLNILILLRHHNQTTSYNQTQTSLSAHSKMAWLFVVPYKEAARYDRSEAMGERESEATLFTTDRQWYWYRMWVVSQWLISLDHYQEKALTMSNWLAALSIVRWSGWACIPLWKVKVWRSTALLCFPYLLLVCHHECSQGHVIDPFHHCVLAVSSKVVCSHICMGSLQKKTSLTNHINHI
jgi:hypothetical protein